MRVAGPPFIGEDRRRDGPTLECMFRRRCDDFCSRFNNRSDLCMSGLFMRGDAGLPVLLPRMCRNSDSDQH